MKIWRIIPSPYPSQLKQPIDWLEPFKVDSLDKEELEDDFLFSAGAVYPRFSPATQVETKSRNQHAVQ
jgi:hypothetical protein